ncbi:MAG: DUF4375 domain-containing protein [bacterium]
MKGFDYRISKSTVKGMNDEELFWKVIEPIWPNSSVIDELKHISYGSPGQRAIYTTTLFMREVDNGGLQQFFWNSSGIYSEEVLKGFRLLGMTLHAEILSQAFKFFPDGKVPLDRNIRQKFLDIPEDQLEAYFEPLNEQLYGEEQLYPFFKRYIELHPEEFFID